MNDNILIAPSILAADFLNLGRDLDRARDADYLHIDIMDGHFVPNHSMGTAIVEAVDRGSALPLDVHLMVTNPDEVAEWYADAGADLVTVHIETVRDMRDIARRLHGRGVKAGVVLNPATPVSEIEGVLDCVDVVLIMSVNPGFGGQGFIDATFDKLRDLRALLDRTGLRPLVEIDGGVSLSNARELAEAGADMLVAGSAIFKNPDPDRVLDEMRELGEIGLAARRG